MPPEKKKQAAVMATAREVVFKFWEPLCQLLLHLKLKILTAWACPCFVSDKAFVPLLDKFMGHSWNDCWILSGIEICSIHQSDWMRWWIKLIGNVYGSIVQEVVNLCIDHSHCTYYPTDDKYQAGHDECLFHIIHLSSSFCSLFNTIC